MALIADRVQETTTTAGTGALALGGAIAGFRTFASVFAIASAVYYAVSDGTNWEVGQGTLSGATTLARDLVLASSTGGAAVNFPAGTKTVWSTVPAGAVVDARDPQLTTGLVVTRANTASGDVDALLVQAGTQATAIAQQQNSPRARWLGYAWNPTTLASESLEFFAGIYTNAGNPVGGALSISSKRSGVTTQLITISPTGTLTLLASSLVVSAGAGFCRRSGIGAADADGLVSENQTAATAGTQSQWSPRFRVSGTGWNGANSVTVGWTWNARPIAGSGSVTCDLVFGCDSTGSSVYTARVAFTAAGDIEQRGNAKGTAARKAVSTAQSTGAAAVQVASIPVPTNNALVVGGRLVGIKSDHTAAYGYRIDGGALNDGGTVTAGGTATPIFGSTTTTAPSVTTSGTNLLVMSGNTAGTTITWTFHPDVLPVTP